jgi:hypothetical protein
MPTIRGISGAGGGMDPDTRTGQAGGPGRSADVNVSVGHGVQVGSFNVQWNVFAGALAAPLALAQLPPLAAGFTGREAELAWAAALLDPSGAARGVTVSVVAGLAGVGKTALAVEAAHAARSAGWFPGGVLFIDLHGYDEVPAEPGQALDVLLRALGVLGEHIPQGVEQRAGLYRSVLAGVSDPVLIVADNASAEAQVRPAPSGFICSAAVQPPAGVMRVIAASAVRRGPVRCEDLV